MLKYRKVDIMIKLYKNISNISMNYKVNIELISELGGINVYSKEYGE